MITRFIPLLFIAILAPSVSLAQSSPCAPPSPTLTFPTISSPWSIAIGDLNGDGLADIVASCGDTVSVLIAEGHGSFRTHVDYPVGSWPICVAIGDLNADGVPDIAVANAQSSTVTTLLGAGDGTFGARRDFQTGNRPYSVAIADINRDGLADLITADSRDNTFSVLFGLGNGQFGRRSSWATGLQPLSVTTGDFNNDGNLDVAVAAYGSYVETAPISVFLGNGDGSFKPRIDLDNYYGGYSIATADLNSDGILDLVSANNDPGTSSGGTVAVLMGLGDGHFKERVLYEVGSIPHYAAIGDLNGDGRPDVAVVNYRSSSVSILLGRGDGTLESLGQVPLGNIPNWVALGDVNQDGKLDVAVTNISSVAVMLNRWVDPSPYPARAFVRGEHRSIPVDGHGRGLCVWISSAGDYDISDIDYPTILMASYGAGQIYAIDQKEKSLDDVDGDGVPELEACFASADVARLFSSVRGRQRVPVLIEGCLTTGGEFQAQLELEIVGDVGGPRVSIRPNPLNPTATLGITTAAAGRLKISLFDILGRRVRTIVEDVPASGTVAVTLDGKDERGLPLASGVYLYKVETSEGTAAGRFAILK